MARDTRLSPDQIERYSRQILVPDLGGKSQIHLMQSRVLVIGAGGLGSPAALYLAAAGIGTLGIVDPDSVELSNLQRQILHATRDIGRAKTESAAQKLQELNPDVEVKTYPVRLESSNAAEIATGYDFIVDGSDNFETKFLVNDVAIRLGIAFSHGGIVRLQGQTMTVLPRKTACYRCLFDMPPPPEEILNCQQSGVLGALSVGAERARGGMLSATCKYRTIRRRRNYDETPDAHLRFDVGQEVLATWEGAPAASLRG